VSAVLGYAKRSNRTLSDEEIVQVIKEHRASLTAT
jgi:hypothetical protein